ncbi:MAG: DUF998 domain-containing protein [archaeon]
MVHRNISIALCVLGLIVADASIAMAVLSKPGYRLFFEFLSNLGESGIAALWFNYGLIVAGIILGIFFLSLAIAFQGKIARTGSLIGILSGIALSGVGIFHIPLPIHFAVSVSFFALAGISAIFIAVSVLREKEIAKPVFWFAAAFIALDILFAAFYDSTASPGLETITVILFEAFALGLALGRKP